MEDLNYIRKITEKETLTEDEKTEWLKVIARYHTVCKLALEKDVPILIDAEESWMQTAADDLIESLMEIYNKDKAIIFSTLQMYRHDRMDYLKALHQKAQEKGFYIGMKIVRGAYMEKERERAEEKGYPSTICVDKQATDDNYDAAIKYMMEHPKMSLFAGTHNEDSSLLVKELATEKGIAVNDQRLWFGQLYGMSDHISYNLSKDGFNVAKYVPFGPVRDVMPYLIRRAEENTSVAGQTSRELNLIKNRKKEKKCIMNSLDEIKLLLSRNKVRLGQELKESKEAVSLIKKGYSFSIIRRRKRQGKRTIARYL